MSDVLRGLRLAALCAAGLMMIAGCSEDLDGGAACPVLCPEQGLEVRDTVLYPVVFDSSLSGYPLIGTEPAIILARRGDTLVTAGVARFDTLLHRITRGDTAQRTITGIDTADLILVIGAAPIARDSVTIELYDVDTTVTGIDTAAVRQLFRPDRFISSRKFHKDSLIGTRRIPVPAAFLAPRIIAGQRVRFGIAVRGDSSVQLQMLTAESQGAAILSYLARAPADTQTLSIVASSNVAPTPGAAASSFADYQVILDGILPPPGVLAVGGVPGNRTYLRFAIPPGLIESNTIVRALLIMTQLPNRAIDPGDTLLLLPRLVQATSVLDPEPGKAALLLGNIASFPMPPISITAADSGQQQFQIATAIAVWRQSPDQTFTRALVLQALDEGLAPHTALFYSNDSSVPQGQRPHLLISYVPRAGFGLP
ncbi:MAG TPA: hypothetical protein VMM77_07150 [Gemmatimonadaceae bacterium]|nr:hypothetical protein [Gemmatimonadaceae bacterium]